MKLITSDLVLVYYDGIQVFIRLQNSIKILYTYIGDNNYVGIDITNLSEGEYDLRQLYIDSKEYIYLNKDDNSVRKSNIIEDWMLADKGFLLSIEI